MNETTEVLQNYNQRYIFVHAGLNHEKTYIYQKVLKYNIQPEIDDMSESPNDSSFKGSKNVLQKATIHPES